MRKAAQKIPATTQRFTEIEDIVDNLVLFSGGRAAMILEVSATNFALQSEEEQQVRILSYASFLNSLSFPLQIIIISRKLDISLYLNLLDQQAAKAPNSILSKHITLYRNFVSELVKTKTVLDKKFYIAISYSFLEKGAGGVANAKNKQAVIADAKATLASKAQSINQEIGRVGLKPKILEKNELIHLFHGIYNHESHGAKITEGIDAPFVRGEKP